MNIILTSTTGGLSTNAIEPFFRTLRLSGYEDPVVVFASKASAECKELFRKYRAVEVDFDYLGMPAVSKLRQKFPWALKMTSRYYRHHRLDERDFRFLYMNCARFFFYHRYLSALSEKPRFVFQADIRDIVFQTNPFSTPFPGGISVATERQTVLDSKGAIKQLWQAVGLQATWGLLRQRIVNGGTIMADYVTTMKYLELQTDHLNRAFFWALFEGLDQALTTYFVHNRLLEPVHIYHNWQGPFLTLASEAIRPENKNAEGLLCNADGAVIPIVHQYDRIKGLYQKGGAVPPCWEFYAS